MVLREVSHSQKTEVNRNIVKDRNFNATFWSISTEFEFFEVP